MADFYTLLTNAGIAYETACKAAGAPIKLAKISVGDGNGAIYNPDATATALKREVWRGDLNALFQDPSNPSWLMAEVTIPPEVGGWYVREAGLWTDTGILYAVVKYPESFKPVMATSGSGKEFYIRSVFETSNAALVTLLIDDTIVKATRSWVSSYVAEELAKLDAKQSVRVATTANIVLSGPQSIDGVAVVAGDRVLVKNQTAAKDNGIYVAAVGAWIRSSDANSSAKVTPNMMISVEVGTAQADTIWQLITDGVIVLGTTSLVFRDVSAGFARLLSPGFTGNPTAPTPSRFDSSNSLSTSEFVRLQGKQYSGFTAFNGNGEIPASSVGQLFTLFGSAANNLKLPPALGIPAGSTVTIYCYNTGSVDVTRAGTDLIYGSFIPGALTSALAVNMIYGDVLELTVIGNSAGAGSWYITGGNMLVSNAVPQFDSGNRPASTKFLKRRGVEWSSFTAVNTSAVLDNSHIGGVVSSGSSTAINITLPTTAQVGIAARIEIISGGVGAVTLLASSGDQLTNMSGSSISIVLGQGDSAILARLAGEWRLVGGSMALKGSALFAASMALPGYSKLPSGFVEQWGQGTTSTSGDVEIVFPIAWSIMPLSIHVTPVIGQDVARPTILMTTYKPATGLSRFAVGGFLNGARIGETFFWRAIGKI
jgi:hypothetical protein